MTPSKAKSTTAIARQEAAVMRGTCLSARSHTTSQLHKRQAASRKIMSIVTGELPLLRLARAVVWTVLLTTCNLLLWEGPSNCSCRSVHVAAAFSRQRSRFGRSNILSASSLFGIQQLQQIRGGSNSSSTSSSSSPDPRNKQPRGGYEEDYVHENQDEDELQQTSPQALSDRDLSEEDEEEEELIPLTEDEWFNAASKEPTEEWDDEEEEEEEEFLAAVDDIPSDQPPTEHESDEEKAFGKAPPGADDQSGASIFSAVEPTTSTTEVSVAGEAKAPSSFATTAVLAEDSAIEEHDSTAYVDRMELADAYDEDAVGLDTDGHSTDAVGVESAVGSVGATPAAPYLPESTPPPSTIPVGSSIDEATRAVLIKELMYRRHEVEAMKPDIAAVVAAKKLHRPFEGMPANWYKEGIKVKQSRQSVMRLLPKIVLPTLLTLLVVIKGPDLVDTGRTLLLPPTISVSSTTVTGSSSGSSENGLESVSGGEPLVPLHGTPLIEANEHTTDIDQPHPHSIKPKHHDTIQDQLDVTWLDKWITAVERQIKAFLRWEI